MIKLSHGTLKKYKTQIFNKRYQILCLITIRKEKALCKLKLQNDFHFQRAKPNFSTKIYVLLISFRIQYVELISPLNLVLFQSLANQSTSNRLRTHLFFFKIFFLVGVQGLKVFFFLNCPCNGGPSMTPNQLRLRASSFKDLSTTNSLDFTPDF